MKPSDIRLKAIIEMLSKHRQRATYGAVGGVVGKPARSVMSGQPKCIQNSWVVSAKTGRPTGYFKHETDSHLEASSIIVTPEELADWLRTHE